MSAVGWPLVITRRGRDRWNCWLLAWSGVVQQTEDRPGPELASHLTVWQYLYIVRQREREGGRDDKY